MKAGLKPHQIAKAQMSLMQVRGGGYLIVANGERIAGPFQTRKNAQSARDRITFLNRVRATGQA